MNSPGHRSCDVVHWDDKITAAKLCWVCGKPLGHCVGIYRYLPSNMVGHGSCVEEKEDADKRLRADPWITERAAEYAGLTVAQYRALPGWQKDRLITESNERGNLLLPS